MKFKVGDKVKANKNSNRRYGFTNEELSFKGVIAYIHPDGSIDICSDRRGDVVVWHELEPEYFDLDPLGTKIIIDGEEYI